MVTSGNFTFSKPCDTEIQEGSSSFNFMVHFVVLGPTKPQRQNSSKNALAKFQDSSQIKFGFILREMFLVLQAQSMMRTNAIQKKVSADVL